MLSLAYQPMAIRIILNWQLKGSASTHSVLRWALLVALAWSQFVVAAHQFEHDHHESEHDCQVCAQIERDEVAGYSVPIMVAEPFRLSPKVAPPSVELPVAGFSHYQSRASPAWRQPL